MDDIPVSLTLARNGFLRWLLFYLIYVFLRSHIALPFSVALGQCIPGQKAKKEIQNPKNYPHQAGNGNHHPG